MNSLTLAIPSKGRLMDQCTNALSKAGVEVIRDGSDRGYRGRLGGMDGIEVAFLSAGEIAANLRNGKVDLGITGNDLLQERAPSATIIANLDFGRADVVVAVPMSWLDVAAMSDLDEVSESFYLRHGRRLRVATKYVQLTRRFFAGKGVTGYRIVESLGATEAAPAAGLAEAIVDITTTGATLAANFLKVLDDGVILRSSAVLAAAQRALGDKRAELLGKMLMG
jgi:ATP phosphoribosyltransferase